MIFGTGDKNRGPASDTINEVGDGTVVQEWGTWRGSLPVHGSRQHAPLAQPSGLRAARALSNIGLSRRGARDIDLRKRWRLRRPHAALFPYFCKPASACATTGADMEAGEDSCSRVPSFDVACLWQSVRPRRKALSASNSAFWQRGGVRGRGRRHWHGEAT